MTLTEILPSLNQLNHREKLEAVQSLFYEFALEFSLLDNNISYPYYSVYDSFEAGDALIKLLEQENGKLETV